jgi:hypothetical protein
MLRIVAVVGDREHRLALADRHEAAEQCEQA